jgi:hypothetical protein
VDFLVTTKCRRERRRERREKEIKDANWEKERR